jgi:translation initiation factor 3 subunit B
VQFAWEPKGSRFAMVTTNEPNAILPPGQLPKNNVEFFHIDAKKGIFRSLRKLFSIVLCAFGELIKSSFHAGRLENKTTNSLSWSPKGRFIVLATIGLSIKHDLEFWDLDFTTDDKVHKNETDPGANMQLLATGEHYGMSEIAWDPSGRYVASTASSFRGSVSITLRVRYRAKD